MNAIPPAASPDYPLECGFRFDRFGVRVPTIFVSPYVEAGTVIRATGETPFDHTSIIASICARWDLAPLTDRDAAAPHFGAVLCGNGDGNLVAPKKTDEIDTGPSDAATALKRPLSDLHNAVLNLAGAIHNQPPGEIENVGDALAFMNNLGN